MFINRRQLIRLAYLKMKEGPYTFEDANLIVNFESLCCYHICEDIWTTEDCEKEVYKIIEQLLLKRKS